MITETIWVVQSSAVPNVMGVVTVGERGVGLSGYLHLCFVERGFEVALHVIVIPFDG